MFSHEERIKTIQFFLKYDCSYTATIRELAIHRLVHYGNGIKSIWNPEKFIMSTEKNQSILKNKNE